MKIPLSALKKLKAYKITSKKNYSDFNQRNDVRCLTNLIFTTFTALSAKKRNSCTDSRHSAKFLLVLAIFNLNAATRLQEVDFS